MKILLTAIATALLYVAAVTDWTPDHHQAPAAPHYTVDDVAAIAGLTPRGIAYQGPEHCQVAVILTSPAEIAVYADAGDPVATNPAHTVGVKYIDPACQAPLEQALQAVR